MLDCPLCDPVEKRIQRLREAAPQYQNFGVYNVAMGVIEELWSKLNPPAPAVDPDACPKCGESHFTLFKTTSRPGGRRVCQTPKCGWMEK